MTALQKKYVVHRQRCRTCRAGRECGKAYDLRKKIEGALNYRKREKLICGGCADDIAVDDTAGAGGCATCSDGIPRCSDCHEKHAEGCI